MGLNEKRAVEDFKSNKFPLYVQELTKVIGFEIPVEVKWETLATQLEGNNFSEYEQYRERLSSYFNSIFAKTTLEGFKQLSAEGTPLGESIKGRIKKIIFCNDHACFEPDEGIRFSDGILTIDLTCANVDNFFSNGRISAFKQVIKKTIG